MTRHFPGLFTIDSRRSSNVSNRQENMNTRGTTNTASNSAQTRDTGTAIAETTESGHTNVSRTRCGFCTTFYKSIDCTAACYFVIALVMVVVGIVVTLATAKEKVINDEAGTIAQLWIVGPIFVSSGLLVLIKSCSHVFKKMRRSVRHQSLTTDQRFNIRGPANFPPSYSCALVAPVPSCIIELDDEQQTSITASTKDVGVGETQIIATNNENNNSRSLDVDADSCRNVSITCPEGEPLPPSYVEALEMLKKKSTSGNSSVPKRPRNTSSPEPPRQKNELKDAATQSELSEFREVGLSSQQPTTSNVSSTIPAASTFNNSHAVNNQSAVRKTRSDTNVTLDLKCYSEDNVSTLVTSKIIVNVEESTASLKMDDESQRTNPLAQTT